MTDQRSDSQLVQATIAGDASAFGVLITRYEPRLLRYAETITGNGDDAADAVQEAFIKIYEHLQSYDDSRSFSAWAYRIVKHESLNWLRRAKRLVTGEAAQLRLENTPAIDSPELAYAQVELRDQVTRGLAALPAHYRAAVKLRYLEQRSYEEIGRSLSMPLGTVATHLSRAKALLKRHFGADRDLSNTA